MGIRFHSKFRDSMEKGQELFLEEVVKSLTEMFPAGIALLIFDKEGEQARFIGSACRGCTVDEFARFVVENIQESHGIVKELGFGSGEN